MRMYGPVLALLAVLAVATPVRAERPTDQIRATADKIIAILNDARLKSGAQKAERRRLIRLELDKRFDWPGIARASLGRHWAKRTREEQKEFVDLFSRFLERTYLDKIEPYYNDLDKIDYQGEKLIDTFASVRTLVTTRQNVAHPVEYRLEMSAARNDWRVYDVVIEGVSLVKNYRVQFDEIIGRSSYQDLIKDIKAKLDSNKE